jgi:hypothetical protein
MFRKWRERRLRERLIIRHLGELNLGAIDEAFKYITKGYTKAAK